MSNAWGNYLHVQATTFKIGITSKTTFFTFEFMQSTSIAPKNHKRQLHTLKTKHPLK
jgi:hypothetical protein